MLGCRYYAHIHFVARSPERRQEEGRKRNRTLIKIHIYVFLVVVIPEIILPERPQSPTRKTRAPADFRPVSRLLLPLGLSMTKLDIPFR